MRRMILILAALMLVVSGVAAVSAYEAHMVNVKAHVENALSVTGPVATEGGEWLDQTVFPEEWLTANITISLSNSFLQANQIRVTKVDYNLYAERKPSGEHWLGDAMYLIVDPVPDWDAMTTGAELIGADPGPLPAVVGPIFPVDATLEKGVNESAMLGVGLDVPVFAGYYNAATDVKPKPSGKNVPTLIIDDQDPRFAPVAGFDGGVELKIQVRKIYP
jgi:hypothetical protein